MAENKIFDTDADKDVLERAILVCVDTGESDPNEIESSLDELERLLGTAGGVAVARVIQSRPSPDVRTYVGSGKLEEISALCEAEDIDLVIFDDELSPSQIRNVEDGIDKEIRVIDRSMLILDIFAKHAVSGEGKLQVELAQLKYTAPRLTGKGTQLSRLGGGIGTRGPGESKLESDRRHMHRRIDALEEEIEKIAKNRLTMRAARDRSGLKKVAIVGYTNAGKSTLLNYLTDAGILSEDKLFATLDTTTRKFTLPCGEDILLTDTVGFIRKLPHQLVKAFRSTLDEAVFADIIVIVTDASDAEASEQLGVTKETLEELGATDKPTLYVLNKCDRLAERGGIYPVFEHPEDTVLVSARTGEGIEELIGKIEAIVMRGTSKRSYLIPNSEQRMLNFLYENASVEDVEYRADGVLAVATVDARVKGIMSKYDTEAKDSAEDEDEDW